VWYWWNKNKERVMKKVRVWIEGEIDVEIDETKLPKERKGRELIPLTVAADEKAQELLDKVALLEIIEGIVESSIRTSGDAEFLTDVTDIKGV
jgi:hypothetical protein